MEYGIWSTDRWEYGIWSMEYGVQIGGSLTIHMQKLDKYSGIPTRL
jgi:hypothetical protein